MSDIARDWSMLMIQELVPGAVRILPPSTQINNVLKGIWTKIGLLSDLSFSQDGSSLTLKTTNEIIRTIIGDNNYSTASFEGIFSGIYKKKVVCTDCKWTKPACQYTFKITNSETQKLESRGKSVYNKQNLSPTAPAYNIKNAIADKIFDARENRVFFADTPLFFSENTIYHMLSNNGPLLDKVSEISRKYFSKTTSAGSTDSKLLIIKNMIQGLGWGAVNIVVTDDTLKFVITNLPHGLQKEPDNWMFLINTIHGYLLTMKKYKISGVEQQGNRVSATYKL